MKPFIELIGVTKSFETAPSAHSNGRAALDGIDLRVDEGDTLVIVGESGSGKSTLLHVIAGIERPTAGEVRFDGEDWAGLSERERTRRRGEQIGVVFQDFHLEGRLSAAENVALPLIVGNVRAREARGRAREALEFVGLGAESDQSIERLSGGQCQRVAVARALVSRPRLLLADEPTANLDADTARRVIELIASYQRERGATIVIVSHDPAALDRPGWRRLECRGGKLTERTDE